jgi:hypothetical protein
METRGKTRHALFFGNLYALAWREVCASPIVLQVGIMVYKPLTVAQRGICYPECTTFKTRVSVGLSIYA